MKKFLFFLLLVPLVISQDYSSSLYGQVLLKDKPYEGFQITAHWINNDSIHDQVTVYTLDKRGAMYERDKSLIGYYFFEEIDAKPGTNIVISFGTSKHNLVVPAHPGKPQKITTLSFNYGVSGEAPVQEEPVEQDPENIKRLVNWNESAEPGIILEEEQEFSPVKNVTKKNVSEVAVSPGKSAVPKRTGTDLVSMFLLVLGLFVMLTIIYFAIRFGTGYVTKTVGDITVDPVENKSKKIMKMNVIDAAEEAVLLKPGLSIIDAVDTLARENATEAIVYDKEFLGILSGHHILTIEDINKKINTLSLLKNLVDKDDSLAEAKDKLNYGVAAIVDKPVPKILTLTGIQKQIIDFSKHFPQKDKSGLPTVRTIMSKHIAYADKNKNVKEIKEELSKSPIVVTDAQKPVGLFYLEDYIRALSKYREHISTVGSVMDSHMVSISPDLNIFEANEFMVSNNIKYAPVMLRNQVIGILYQKDLVDEIFRYLKTL